MEGPGTLSKFIAEMHLAKSVLAQGRREGEYRETCETQALLGGKQEPVCLQSAVLHAQRKNNTDMRERDSMQSSAERRLRSWVSQMETSIRRNKHAQDNWIN